MRLRVLPPALSSLSLHAIAAGLRPARGGDRTSLAHQLALRTGAREVLLLDSGTSALRLAIAAVAARAPGRPVALPAWACYDVVSAAVGARAPIAFYDIDPLTLQPAPMALAGLARTGIAGIVLVHAFGVPVDVRTVRSALPPGTPVIEDAAQAWGASRAGSAAGALGDLALFSFGRGKGITGGSGGALIVHDGVGSTTGTAESATRGAGWKNVVACLALWTLTRPALYRIPSSLPFLHLGETRFRAPHPSAPMSPVAESIVRASLLAADRAAEGRRAVAQVIRDAVPGSPRLEHVRVDADTRPGWLRLPMLASDAAARDRFTAGGRALGVAASYPQSLPALARALGVPFESVGTFEGAQTLAERLLTVPTHEFVRPRDVARIVAWLRES